ncbi:unnamed protein product [Paramecium sonneborni]|uniref:Uncharacterized protein n=1 Tax=Paramecium sonneborni TaxID=65129 RepID=A0A8S1Q6H7_9CILI|nr:unnamed protein product [Paramecium sonneborni]
MILLLMQQLTVEQSNLKLQSKNLCMPFKKQIRKCLQSQIYLLNSIKAKKCCVMFTYQNLLSLWVKRIKNYNVQYVIRGIYTLSKHFQLCFTQIEN